MRSLRPGSNQALWTMKMCVSYCSQVSLENPLPKHTKNTKTYHNYRHDIILWSSEISPWVVWLPPWWHPDVTDSDLRVVSKPHEQRQSLAVECSGKSKALRPQADLTGRAAVSRAQPRSAGSKPMEPWRGFGTASQVTCVADRRWSTLINADRHKIHKLWWSLMTSMKVCATFYNPHVTQLMCKTEATEGLLGIRAFSFCCLQPLISSSSNRRPCTAQKVR